MMYKIKMLLLMLVVVLCMCSCATEKGGAVSAETDDEQVKNEMYVVSTCVDDFTFSFEESENRGYKASNCYSESIWGKGARLYYGINKPEGFVSETISVDETGNINRENLTNADRNVFMAGPVIGSDSFVALTSEGSSEPIIRIETRKPDGSLKDERKVDFLTEDSQTEEILMDEAGYAHLLMSGNGNSDDLLYRIVDQAGNVAYSQDYEKKLFFGFIATPDNEVAFDIKTDEFSGTHEVFVFDIDASEPKILFTYTESGETPILAINVVDANSLIYMNKSGIYISDYKFEKAEEVFNWQSNGILHPSFPKASSVKIDEDGRIYAFAGDYGNQTYLVLEKGDTEIRTVKLAVLGDSDFYAEAVAGFNRMHPDMKLAIEHYGWEDKTSFYTKMIAGEAPVLIDKSMFSLAEVTEYLEPLDELFDTEELNIIRESVKNLGRINGKIYAAPCDCYIDTLASDKRNHEWDYKAFIQSVIDSKTVKSIYNNYWNLGKAYVATYFFDNGNLDSLYFEPDGKTPKFNTDEVRKVIGIIDNYGDDSLPQSFIAGLKDGTMLCERIQIRTPKELIAFHDLYGDNIDLVGYPGKEGARHYLCSNNMITVLKNASQEDKHIAFEFIKYILSEELQNKMALKGQRIFFNFSVRDDVFKQQVEAIDGEEYVTANFTPNDYRIPKETDKAALIEEIENIMAGAYIRLDADSEYSTILYEEFYDYYSGKIAMDELIRNLESRLKIYIMERE